MAEQRGARFEIGHPAPDSGRVSLTMLFIGFAGAPIAWSLQLLAMSGIAGIACATTLGGSLGLQPSWATPALIATNVAALIGSAVALAVGYRNLKRTRSELRGGNRGLMDAGEGRTRYVSVWSVWTGILFILAILFNTISLFWGGGVCGL